MSCKYIDTIFAQTSLFYGLRCQSRFLAFTRARHKLQGMYLCEVSNKRTVWITTRVSFSPKLLNLTERKWNSQQKICIPFFTQTLVRKKGPLWELPNLKLATDFVSFCASAASQDEGLSMKAKQGQERRTQPFVGTNAEY